MNSIIREISRISHRLMPRMYQMEFLLQVWSINAVQFTSQPAKHFLIKWFSEYIRQLLIGTNMLKIDVSFSSMILKDQDLIP